MIGGVAAELTTAGLVAPGSLQIDESLARALIADQFPIWAGLQVRAVPQPGWDNRSFLLGDDFVIRLPSAAAYEAQVQREQRWLPHLASHVPFEIPEPVALGRPGRGYPWSWSVYRWIAGKTAASAPPGDMGQFAIDLALVLNALHRVPAEGGPDPGRDNFHRGGPLEVYDEEARQAIAALGSRINRAGAIDAWEEGLASRWTRPPVWVHGDMALGNLLVRGGRLAAVIDFGQLCVGDPACDLAIAWTCLRAQHRQAFRGRLEVDAATWQRGRAWALWKAAIVAAGLVATNAIEGKAARLTLDEILDDLVRTGP